MAWNTTCREHLLVNRAVAGSARQKVTVSSGIEDHCSRKESLMHIPHVFVHLKRKLVYRSRNCFKAAWRMSAGLICFVSVSLFLFDTETLIAQTTVRSISQVWSLVELVKFTNISCKFCRGVRNLASIFDTSRLWMNEWMNEWKCSDLKCIQKPRVGLV